MAAAAAGAKAGCMTTTAPAARRVTYRAVLAEPRFRLLFVTRSLAIGADTLRTVALSMLVFAVTGSPLLAAVTYGIAFLPQAIGGTLLGALADRVRPRPLITAGYGLEAATAAVLAMARLPAGASLALVAAIACLTPVFGGASSRLMAEVLAGDAYVLGRSLANIAASASQVLGLAAGGATVAALGARPAGALDEAPVRKQLREPAANLFQLGGPASALQGRVCVGDKLLEVVTHAVSLHLLHAG